MELSTILEKFKCQKEVPKIKTPSRVLSLENFNFSNNKENPIKVKMPKIELANRREEISVPNEFMEKARVAG